MRQASKRIPESAEKTVRDIRRATRRHHSAEEKIRIVLEGLSRSVRLRWRLLGGPAPPPRWFADKSRRAPQPAGFSLGAPVKAELARPLQPREPEREQDCARRAHRAAIGDARAAGEPGRSRSPQLTGTTKKSACVTHLTLGATGDMRMQSRRSHAAEGDTMRKIVVLAAIAALIAAAVGIWSTAPATYDGPKVAGQRPATPAPGPA